VATKKLDEGEGKIQKSMMRRQVSANPKSKIHDEQWRFAMCQVLSFSLATYFLLKFNESGRTTCKLHTVAVGKQVKEESL